MLGTAGEPLESLTWRSALAVSADPAVIAAVSEQQFLAALRDQLPAVGGQKVWHRIALGPAVVYTVDYHSHALQADG